MSDLLAVTGLAAARTWEVDPPKMSAALLGSATSLATSPAELVVLIATIVLASLRAGVSVTGIALTRRGTYLLTGLTIALLVIFTLLVVLRFRTLG